MCDRFLIFGSERIQASQVKVGVSILKIKVYRSLVMDHRFCDFPSALQAKCKVEMSHRMAWGSVYGLTEAVPCDGSVVILQFQNADIDPRPRMTCVVLKRLAIETKARLNWKIASAVSPSVKSFSAICLFLA
jgi:hypothetical protein